MWYYFITDDMQDITRCFEKLFIAKAHDKCSQIDDTAEKWHKKR